MFLERSTCKTEVVRSSFKCATLSVVLRYFIIQHWFKKNVRHDPTVRCPDEICYLFKKNPMMRICFMTLLPVHPLTWIPQFKNPEPNVTFLHDCLLLCFLNQQLPRKTPLTIASSLFASMSLKKCAVGNVSSKLKKTIRWYFVRTIFEVLLPSTELFWCVK